MTASNVRKLLVRAGALAKFGYAPRLRLQLVMKATIHGPHSLLDLKSLIRM